LVARPTNDGWEDGTWRIVTSETALAESGTVVDNQVSSFGFFVRGHDEESFRF
jgi:hypothetical protein